MEVDLSKETLDERDVRLTIAGWEASKPTEPASPEPLFVWPKPGKGSFVIYLFRLYVFERQMKKTHWRLFHDRYHAWYVIINDHYNALANGADYTRRPELRKLHDYLNHAQKRLHENMASE